ncbi:uncharacterized protein HKW66_Vig0185410 [Vigna angularis]|uniref:DUF674 domain-containing protein n=1 Tax=Phaseolus angularis TaxID=3914 RepID=A0A8T0KZT2_PHAAN|nr:uncharacterized protein HKW66_Vig0185410 [Vigna angularis]
MAADGTEEHVTLKLMVMKGKKKVVIAEAGKEFVDILFSFLTLPLGTIARLVREESKVEPPELALSSLYQSVQNLDDGYLCTDTCREMLLRPRNSMEAYCRRLELNIDDTEPTEYFVCNNLITCSYTSPVMLSTFKNENCRCGCMLAKRISAETSYGFVKKFVDPISYTNNNGKGYLKGPTTYMVTDDLVVTPSSSISVMSLVSSMSIPVDDLKEKVVSIGTEEGVRILQASLSSTSVLTLGLSHLTKVKEDN